MSKHRKLIEKFKYCEGQFPWKDLVILLEHLGFVRIEGAGSRVSFDNGVVLIKLHKPHPQKEVKAYAVKQVKRILLFEDLI